MRKRQWIPGIWALVTTVLVVAGLFLSAFRFDNKYTGRAAVAQDGFTIVAVDALAEPIYLVDGWELWADALLAPDELSAAAAPMRVYIGEYLSSSSMRPDRSPYGSATWRLRLRYDGPPTDCTLLLPEVFCAWRLYLNGEEVASRGSLTPYRPQVQDTAVALTLAPETELVLQTRNETHYYSGLTYPPVLGSVQAVSLYTGMRLLGYGFLCCGALTAALFSVAFWFGGRQTKRRDPVALLFGVLSLAFAVWVSYPFSRFVGAPSVRLLYALEDAAFLLIIWCALRILLHLCGFCHTGWGQALSRAAFGMLLCGVAVPLLVIPLAPAFASLYGPLVTGYQLLSSLLLVSLAAYGTLRCRAGCITTLCGTAALAAGLFAGAVTVYSFEPARFFWFEEYGASALVLCFALLMTRRHSALLRENLTLSEHLQEEVERKTQQMGLLVQERDDLIAKFLHDMRSPAAFMLSYAQLVRENNVGLDERTREQLAVIEEKCGDLSARVHQVQQYTIENPLITEKKPTELCAFLREFYRFCRPDVEIDGHSFLLALPDTPCHIRADGEKLNRLLQNLIYNAVGCTPPDGEIKLLLTMDDDNAYLTVEDTGCGISPEILPKIFDRFYTTRAAEGGSGLGLYIVRTIAREHGGEVTVRSKPGEGSAFTVSLPRVE